MGRAKGKEWFHYFLLAIFTGIDELEARNIMKLFGPADRHVGKKKGGYIKSDDKHIGLQGGMMKCIIWIEYGVNWTCIWFCLKIQYVLMTWRRKTYIARIVMCHDHLPIGRLRRMTNIIQNIWNAESWKEIMQLRKRYKILRRSPWKEGWAKRMGKKNEIVKRKGNIFRVVSQSFRKWFLEMRGLRTVRPSPKHVHAAHFWASESFALWNPKNVEQPVRILAHGFLETVMNGALRAWMEQRFFQGWIGGSRSRVFLVLAF